jgi:predicted O-methyltransferase YrrM
MTNSSIKLSPRLRIKYAWARRKKFIIAKTDRFTINLDTSYADDVGQVLIMRKLIERGKWEPGVLQACFQHIGSNETVAEVGTWIGPYSVLLGKYIVPHGQVIGFEPDPAALRQCVINLARNNVRNTFI